MTTTVLAHPRRRGVPPGMMLAGAALAFVYTPVIRDLAVAWWQINYHTYGFLVTPFSAWLVWESRAELGRAPYARWRPGIAVVAAGLLVLAGGAQLESLALRALSVPVVLAGLGLFALGRAGFRPLAFPIAFLALMTPLPREAIVALSSPLQHLAALVAAIVLNAAGIPAVRDGLLVALPTVTLQIDESCNGLRFLLAMLVVGVAFGWLTQRTGGRRVAVVVAALAIAVVANLVRVTGTGVIAHYFGAEAATGFLHVLYGKLVYLVMAVPFAAVVLLLRREPGRAPSASLRG